MIRHRLLALFAGICGLLGGVASAAGNITRPLAFETFATFNMTRYNQAILAWGGNGTTEQPVNWGLLLFNLIGVYPDAIGQIAYVIIFAIPFVMMYIAQADITLPAIIGLMFSLYVFTTLPEQYIIFAIGCFAISLTALIWSLMKRY
jgi:hypothetical protein